MTNGGLDLEGSLIGTAAAASLLGVRPRQVARYVEHGVLAVAFREDGARGAYFFDSAVVEALATRRASAASGSAA